MDGALRVVMMLVFWGIGLFLHSTGLISWPVAILLVLVSSGVVLFGSRKIVGIVAWSGAAAAMLFCVLTALGVLDIPDARAGERPMVQEEETDWGPCPAVFASSRIQEDTEALECFPLSETTVRVGRYVTMQETVDLGDTLLEGVYQDFEYLLDPWEWFSYSLEMGTQTRTSRGWAWVNSSLEPREDLSVVDVTVYKVWAVRPCLFGSPE